MMGRAVLVDTDAIIEEQLDFALSSTPIPKVKELKFKTKNEELYRDIVHELAGRIGISLSENAYRRIVERILQYVLLLPTAQSYKADAAKKKKEGKVVIDYDTIIARNVVCSAAVLLLIEVQTRIPEYVILYPLLGCKATFEGYPLGPETNMGGMTYLACAVASIMSKGVPWDKTGFQAIKAVPERQQSVLQYMNAILAKIKKINPSVEQDLVFKRSYLETKAAKMELEQRNEKIPEGFLPLMAVLMPEEAANGENTVVPEVASRMGSGEQALAIVWIRQAHALARKTATIIQGSLAATTTCCMANITSPGTFWQSASDLPQLSRRTMKPNYRVHPLRVHFVPRPLQEIVVEADDSLNYRLFLKVCHTGPQKGQLHEVGLTNVCRWCGFQFPSHPAVVDADTQESDGQSAVTSQGIDTSREAFEDLLDEVHRFNKVEPYRSVHVPTVEEITSNFANMTPQPFDGWYEAINQTFEDLAKVVQSGRQIDLINALGPLSNIAATSEQIVRRRILESVAVKSLNSIVELSWDNLLQALNTYFLVPYKRMLVNFNLEAYKIVLSKPKLGEEEKKKKKDTEQGIVLPYSEYVNLADDHKVDIDKIMEADVSLIKGYMPYVQKVENAKLKLQDFVDRLAVVLSFKEHIHAGILPGRATTLKYIKDALFFGLLADLVNPDVMPETGAGGAAGSDMGMTSELLMKIVAGSLRKFNKERLAFSDDQLRELIMARNEKEKVDIISQFDKMTPEEKEVQLVLKANRMGRWAVGGSKAIYRYDVDRYGVEKIERLEAGLVDFPGRETDVGEPGREFDVYGLPIMGAEAGYDVMQEGEDDA
jgi:hypothetical protein